MQVEYSLPLTQIDVVGSVAITTDAVLKGDPVETPQATVSIALGSHEHRGQTLKLEDDWLKASGATLTLSEDGRLTSAKYDEESQLGRVVLGVVGAGATVAGILTANLPLTAAGGAVVTKGIRTFVDGEVEVEEEPGAGAPPEELTDAQRVANAYREKFPREAELRDRYTQLVAATVTRVCDLSATLVDAESGGDWQATAEVRRLQELLPLLRAELARLDEHFRAWRATTLSSRTVQYARRFSIDDVALAGVSVAEDGTVNWPEKGVKDAIRVAWEKLGVLVVMYPGGRPAPPEDVVLEGAIRVRVPTVVRLSVYERGEGDKAVLREVAWHRVVSSLSETREITLGDGDGSLEVGFGELGTVTSVTSRREASAITAADVLEKLPATVTGGLEQAGKIRAQLGDLRTAGLNEEAAAAAKRVELKQQELALAGLNATEADYATLERLKQEADIAAQRKAIRDAAPAAPPTAEAAELAALRAQTDALGARRDALAAARALEAETQLGALRLEVERLKLERERDNGK